MDGIHDMGGMHGFGAIPRDEDDDGTVFHQPWHGRIFALAFVVESFVPGANVDSGRHAIERIEPAAYLAAPYYRRWLASVESLIIDAGICTADDLDARVALLRGETGNG